MTERWIYFLRNPHTEHIKIGCSKDLCARNKVFRTNQGDFSVLLGKHRGNFQMEAVLKRKWREFRVGSATEVFLPVPQITSYIRDKAMPAAMCARPETAIEFLQAIGTTVALNAIREYRRLCEVRPERARGGWTLWEILGGKGPYTANGELFENPTGGRIVIRYLGHAFTFPVYAEVCTREGRPIPAGALFAGRVPPHKRRVPTRWRNAIEARKVARCEDVASDQRKLF